MHDPTQMTLRVAEKVPVADRIVLLNLVDPEGGELPAWEPGAHIDLLLRDQLVRQYSLCGDPQDRYRYSVAVLREEAGRGGSMLVHDKLEVGAQLAVRGPRNNFGFLPADRYLFIAGGVGITPIRAMVKAAERGGAAWELVYGGRTSSSMAFLPELRAAYGERILARPQDEFGLLDLDQFMGQPRPGTLVYCCGPEALIKAVEIRASDWPSGHLHVERFVPRPVDNTLVDREFEVELRGTGVTVTVPPHRSILEVAEEVGAVIFHSCLEGTCGTCVTTVLEGEPEHRDSVLPPDQHAANDTMMVCVSRCRGERLVLDL